jgi:NADH-quinone oxidoreductase subunit A
MAASSATLLAAYLVLFGGVGLAFVFANLLLGRFLRPQDPHAEKLEIYECGEPTIGSSYVQFDLRFYVVALVFIIFDVEVAFLFPWATVFGKATNLQHTADPVVQMVGEEGPELAPAVAGVYRELGVRRPSMTESDPARAERAIREGAASLSQLALAGGGFFFLVLFVGFAYEWRTGALDWVRAIQHEYATDRTVVAPRDVARQESVLSA